jgi:hypothetical protein
MIELLKDVTGIQPLRHDVFIRGATRLDPVARDAALRPIRLGLAVPHARRKLSFDTAAGHAAMSPGLYEPAFARLAEGPATIGDLLDGARTTNADSGAGNPAELLAMLIGTGQAIVVADPAARMDPICVRLNAAMVAEKTRGGSVMQPIALAVPALGGGFSLPGLAAFAVLRQHDWLSEATIDTGPPPPDDALFAAWADRAVPGGAADVHAKLVAGFQMFFEEQAPVLRLLGLVC